METIASLSVLILLGLGRYSGSFFSAGYLLDEAPYLKGIQALFDGGSPYVDRYIYPPTLALAGAALLSFVDLVSLKLIIRFLTLCGACLAVWYSLASASLPRIARWPISMALLCLWPALVEGLTVGNISPLITGFTIFALCIRGLRPVMAGVGLGAMVSLKPVPGAAIIMLLVQGTRARKFFSPNRQLVGGVALLVCLLCAWLGREHLATFLQSELTHSRALGNISLHAWIQAAGLALSPFVFYALMMAAAAATAYWVKLDDRSSLCAVCCLSILSAPVVWLHTLLLALPVQVLSIHKAISRGRHVGKSKERVAAALIVIGANLVLMSAEGYGAWQEVLPSLAMMARGLPTLSLLGLGAYVISNPDKPAEGHMQ